MGASARRRRGAADRPIAVRGRIRKVLARWSMGGVRIERIGRSEIYAQPFPGPGPKVQISKEGGIDPVWRRSGGEIYYRRGTKMMVASVTTAPELRASAPTALWEGNYPEGSGSSCGMGGVTASNYDVTSDGQRFLMVRDDDAAVTVKQIVVVLNWAQELKNPTRPAGASAKFNPPR